MLHKFHTYVASVFIWMSYVLQWLFKCFHMFLQVFRTHVLSVSSVFKRILQMFHIDVSKVDRVLCILQHDSPATTCCSCWDVVHTCGKRRNGVLHGWSAGSKGSGADGPSLARTCNSRGCPSRCQGASIALCELIVNHEYGPQVHWSAERWVETEIPHEHEQSC
jgi:hypothetical protein